MLPFACPAAGGFGLACASVVCPTTFEPVCGEGFVSKRRQRFNNVCQLQVATCQNLRDRKCTFFLFVSHTRALTHAFYSFAALVNLGNVSCKDWLHPK